MTYIATLLPIFMNDLDLGKINSSDICRKSKRLPSQSHTGPVRASPCQLEAREMGVENVNKRVGKSRKRMAGVFSR